MIFYIDPGTGSMLFTILIGVLGALVYAFRNVLMKAKFAVTGGRKSKEDEANRVPIVIFTDSKRYWNLFRPICDELEKRRIPSLYLTASEDDPALSETNYTCVRTEFAGKGNRAFAKMNMIRADVVLSSTPGLDVYQWKRSRGVKTYVHIPHGIYDLTTYRMFGLDYYDAVLLAGSFQGASVRKIEQARNLPEKELTVAGMPYLDEMLKRKKEEEAQTEGEEAGEKPAEAAKTVLLAPSWGKSAIFARFGEKIISELLKTDYHIIVRPHPQSVSSEKEMLDKLMAKFPDSDRLEWNYDTDNYEVLKKSDVLISDFSGVLFEFSLVYDKPVIYTKPEVDWAEYDNWWLGEELWTFKTLPSLGAELTQDNFDNLTAIIDDCLNNPKFSENRQIARDETWANCGKGAELVADYLIGKYDELKEKESKKKDPEKKDPEKKKSKKKESKKKEEK